jgi:S-DNA-T family DNA segregation ATPase FtsK/SpoIIIE
MATVPTDVRLRAPRGVEPKNSRRNEIVAILLFAVSALLALCLVSYNPNDASWSAAGSGGARNLIGSIGANLAAALFQTFGVAAFMLPLLLAAAAWRRFRTRRIHAPLSRVAGLLTVTLAIASLCALYITSPLADRSFNAGGFIGALVAESLRGLLNTVGASVLLLALAAIGLLLVTNFSFVHAYERVAAALNNPSGHFRLTLERFRAWRESRRAQAQARAELRREARAEREREIQESLHLSPPAMGGAADVARPSVGAKRMAGEEARPSAATAVRRAATAAPATDEKLSREDEVRAKLAKAEAELAAIADLTAKPTPPAAPAKLEVSIAPKERRAAAAPSASPALPAPADDSWREAPDVDEMMRTAAVVRADIDDDEAVLEDEIPVAPPRAPKREEKKAFKPALLDYDLPDHSFLTAPEPRQEQADEVLLGIATRLAEKCKEFNVMGQIKHICPGPVVTTYEFKPDPGVKYSRVTGLVDDLCIALEAESIRIDRLPGKPHVGIEVPNPERETIQLREVIESAKYRESASKLTLALGKTIDGMNYVADLARMPHLLIAGATGTGKSVCINSLLVSILYKARPDEVKFILIDPKRLELGLYADIPHLATPIITDPKRASNALKWAVAQMEQRYKDLARWGVRNIDGFNAEIERRNNVLDFDEDGLPHKSLPYIVIIIDELADLMMTCGHDVEESITRLAQMARAVGIHLVLATQRPSVDVITGLIKANFPSRIAFRVSSKVDSRTIIDANGAEALLGRGDMLFLPPGTSRLVRVHGAYLDEAEVNRIVSHIKAQSAPVYDETITQSEEEASGGDGAGGDRDELFDQALRICVEMKRASTSVLQRRLRIGYGRAAALLDGMEREGYIGQADGSRPRPVLGKSFETVSHWDSLQEDSADDF